MITDEQHGFLCPPIIRAGAEAIFLLATTRIATTTESIFEPRPPTRIYTGHHFLLVLVASRDERARSQLQDSLEHQRGQPPITTLVLDTDQFRQWLREGHPFAHSISRKVRPLYNAADPPLPEAAPINEEKLAAENRILYRQTLSLAQGFMAGADLFLLRGQYRLAAFMLHQATEQALRTLIVLHTGLHLQTHNVERLLRYCQLFRPGLFQLFDDDESDRSLLHLLQKAYIDARYRSTYTINGQQAAALAQKVKTIQEIFTKEGPCVNGHTTQDACRPVMNEG